mmetsp:Transcript_22041/g.39662  ORF Transcript_22041/g.39662 Transcript_22041/m.39662 type:complete len:221 (-) Transcript_22041:331-993(-)
MPGGIPNSRMKHPTGDVEGVKYLEPCGGHPISGVAVEQTEACAVAVRIHIPGEVGLVVPNDAGAGPRCVLFQLLSNTVDLNVIAVQRPQAHTFIRQVATHRPIAHPDNNDVVQLGGAFVECMPGDGMRVLRVCKEVVQIVPHQNVAPYLEFDPPLVVWVLVHDFGVAKNLVLVKGVHQRVKHGPGLRVADVGDPLALQFVCHLILGVVLVPASVGLPLHV